MIRAIGAGMVLAAVLPGSSLAQTPVGRPARFILEFGPQGTLTIADSMRFGFVGGRTRE